MIYTTIEIDIHKKLELEEFKNNCPECGSNNIVLDRIHGDLVCEGCGLVINDVFIDDGKEWQSFSFQEEYSKSRTGPPITELVHDKGLTTFISDGNTDYSGNPLTKNNRSQIYRLRKWQRRLRRYDAYEKNLSKALAEINRIGSMLGLSNKLREDTAIIYKVAMEKNLIRGRSINNIAAACVYIACKSYCNPRTLDEIAKITSLSKKEIGRTYRFLLREMHLKLKPVQARDYIERFCNELGLGFTIQKIAKKILDDAEELGILSGKCPSGLAAAAIYIAAKSKKIKITQKKIADVCSVTEVTVRNRYKELVRELEIRAPFN